MSKIVVVIPSYKNERWCEKNLQSVFSQTHTDFRVIYTDDCSPDNTANLVQSFIDKNNLQDKITFIRNEARKGAMCNLYNMIHSCDDKEIIVTADGDDWLAHNDVLKKIDQVYSDPFVWFTWGSYMDHPQNTRGCSKPIPREVLNASSYRRHPWCTSHLRTFYAALFKKIKQEDFYGPEGNWLMAGWDLPIMFGMVEMAGHHGKYIHDILYIYNNENPIQDYKIHLQEQQKAERLVRAKPSYAMVEECQQKK